ncbi:MAG: flagellar assembly protein FliW [Desulfonauticus sp.]|nr:flagellar assembly protein FliW [Desulfonauticus sp.]
MGQIKINSRIGEVIIDKDKIIKFPRGLIGFENYSYFVLLQIKENSPFLLLQSIQNSRLGLIVADPYVFFPDYKVVLSKVDEKILGIDDESDLSVLVTVSIPPGKPEETVLNLLGPLVINNKNRRGVQLILTDADCPAHLPLSFFSK